ncbi:hypothetical protein BpHYR1_029454 [Brachionus plicatilis]|uniref:Uncharacterized protein n=1 Tax=Brachionus plicatilis TaxID=10195 RepID=A0A3M7PW80_BRAPC|nr:hypothetical protein BpHYR1_029454 [Brachionus plicatilis]
MNLNKEKSNQRLILLRICRDYPMFLLQRSFDSSTIGPNILINHVFKISYRFEKESIGSIDEICLVIIFLDEHNKPAWKGSLFVIKKCVKPTKMADSGSAKKRLESHTAGRKLLLSIKKNYSRLVNYVYLLILTAWVLELKSVAISFRGLPERLRSESEPVSSYRFLVEETHFGDTPNNLAISFCFLSPLFRRICCRVLQNWYTRGTKDVSAATIYRTCFGIFFCFCIKIHNALSYELLELNVVVC